MPQLRGEERARITGKGLTEDDVRAIRALPPPFKDIASQFKISVAMVSHIRRRNRWKHVKNDPCVIG